MRRIRLAAVLVCLCLAGCDDYMWWEYRDDPYVADLALKGKQEVLRGINSVNKGERQAALRIVAHQAGELRRRGAVAESDKLEAIVIRRYFVEKDSEVRACIVRICATDMGTAGTEMITFLRDRIAAGEYPGYAALSLATLGWREALPDIDPLTRHPAPEIRLQAAVALSVLGDPRGYEPVCRVWRGMHAPAWPDRIEGVSLSEARANLERRALRSFGRPLQ